MKELELILASMASLGAVGKEAFIWWLIVSYGFPLLGFLCAAGLVLKIAGMIRDCSVSYDTMKRIAVELGAANQYKQFNHDNVLEKVRELNKIRQ